MLPNSQIAALELSYQEMLDLCDLLEGIADDLPHTDSRLCLSAADVLEPMVDTTHRLEEAVLFPMLAASNRVELKRATARLRQEHISDSSTAEEVSEILRDVARGRPSLSPDAIGYLLRSFFDGMRRHIHGERELMQLFLPPADGRASH